VGKVVEHAFACTPPLDRRDPNPVTKIYVIVDFDQSNVLRWMNVIHTQFNGNEIWFQQYQTDTVSSPDASKPVYNWHGTNRKDPRLTMGGGLYYGADNNWHYAEEQWKNGEYQFHVIASCRPTTTPDGKPVGPIADEEGRL
jgi:hypothetical protein